jgi:hypothetical protein
MSLPPIGAILGLAVIAGAPAPPSFEPSAPPTGRVRVAAICSKTAEKIDGNSKTCFYSCSGVGFQMTVAVGAVCPLTIPAPRG